MINLYSWKVEDYEWASFFNISYKKRRRNNEVLEQTFSTISVVRSATYYQNHRFRTSGSRMRTNVRNHGTRSVRQVAITFVLLTQKTPNSRRDDVSGERVPSQRFAVVPTLMTTKKQQQQKKKHNYPKKLTSTPKEGEKEHRGRE